MCLIKIMAIEFFINIHKYLTMIKPLGAETPQKKIYIQNI